MKLFSENEWLYDQKYLTTKTKRNSANMKKSFFYLLISIVSLVSHAQNRIVIKNVAIVDVKAGKVKFNKTVIVEGNRITSIRDKGNIPQNAIVIDGKGKYLIPGLWDMHAHTLTNHRYEYAFPLLLANGVTGVREMGSNLVVAEVNQIIQDISKEKILGPRFGAFTCQIVDGAGTQLGNVATEIKTPDDARRLVQIYKQTGVNFIKPYNLLSREVYNAIVDEAKKQKIPVEGHVPFSMSAIEVSDVGQLVIEHNFGVLVCCSNNEEELSKELQAKKVPWIQVEGKAAITFDSIKARQLCERFARNGTWSCPTLSFQKLYPLDGSDTTTGLTEYIPKSQLISWRTGYERFQSNSLLEYRKIRYDMLRKLVLEMHHAGVGILAGTDLGAFYAFPGFSLHNELEELVKVGLSPADALQIATLNAARFLGREKELGTVEKGKIADLVLLDANPLNDIRNTKKVFAVIVNGKLLQRADLDRLLQQAKQVAAR